MKIAGLIFLTIFLFLLLALLICLFLKIRLVLLFSKKAGSKFSSSVHIELFGGKIKKDISLCYKKKEPSEKADKPDGESDKLTFTQKVKDYYQKFLLLKNTWAKSKRGVRKRIIAEEISLNISFGTGDAAHTGIITGSLWGAIYNVIAFFANFIRVTEPQINITPDYENELFEFDGKCILKLCAANIISVFLILYINYFIEKRKQTKKEKAAINNVNTN